MGEGSPGGTSRKPILTGADSWAGLVPKARREQWPWLCREGDMTRGYSRRVKGHRTKQREDASCVKVAWLCEDTLEACTTRGVTAMPL
jgi:hypothetical protein